MSYFEAPPETVLEPNTDYVVVWTHKSGTRHRLRLTSSTNEDGEKLNGFWMEGQRVRGGEHLQRVRSRQQQDVGARGLRRCDHRQVAVPDGEEPRWERERVLGSRLEHARSGVAGLQNRLEFRRFPSGRHRLPHRGWRQLDSRHAAAVSVAVWTDGDGDSPGKPGTKLFDLVSPSSFADDTVPFFAAPPDTVLAPNTDYVVVWSHLSGTFTGWWGLRGTARIRWGWRASPSPTTSNGARM